MLRRCLFQYFANPFFHWLAEPVHDYLHPKQRCNHLTIYLGMRYFLTSVRSKSPGRLLTPKCNRSFIQRAVLLHKTKARCQGRRGQGGQYTFSALTVIQSMESKKPNLVGWAKCLNPLVLMRRIERPTY